MGTILTILKYLTIVIPLVELIAKRGARLYRTIKGANVKRREKTKLRKKLDEIKKHGGPKLPPGAAIAVIAIVLLSGCASPIFDAVRAQLPQQASDIQIDIEGYIKADVTYLTATGSEGYLSLVCEIQSADLTGDIGLTYRCPIVGNQFGLEVAYLEMDGTGKVMNIKGFENLTYSIELEQ